MVARGESAGGPQAPEKSREVTLGPYRWSASATSVILMGVGVAIAGYHVAAAAIGLYLAVTMTAAIRTERFLRASSGWVR
jgi:hypothetical protein